MASLAGILSRLKEVKVRGCKGWTRASSLLTVMQERVMARLIYASNVSLDDELAEALPADGEIP